MIISCDQGIIAYDTSVTINVTNDQLETNVAYFMQVFAVNAAGQDPIGETTLYKFLHGRLSFSNWYPSIV